jgi:hypothetical protein
VIFIKIGLGIDFQVNMLRNLENIKDSLTVIIFKLLNILLGFLWYSAFFLKVEAPKAMYQVLLQSICVKLD